VATSNGLRYSLGIIANWRASEAQRFRQSFWALRSSLFPFERNLGHAHCGGRKVGDGGWPALLWLRMGFRLASEDECEAILVGLITLSASVL